MQCGKEKMSKSMKLNVFTVREGIFLIKTPATEKLNCQYCRKKTTKTNVRLDSVSVKLFSATKAMLA